MTKSRLLRRRSSPSTRITAGEQDAEDEDGGTEEDRLYNGNRAPPEFYEQIMKGTNPVEFKGKQYASGTGRQLENCKFFWIQSA